NSRSHVVFFSFLFTDTATTQIYTFPYTTLFRSEVAGHLKFCASCKTLVEEWQKIRNVFRQVPHVRPSEAFIFQVMEKIESRERRSEEHTSELQSRSDLVCRLLLEKKKKIKNLLK